MLATGISAASSASTFKPFDVFMIGFALLSIVHLSTAFRVYDIDEMSVLEKRASELMAAINQMSDDDGRHEYTVPALPDQFFEAAADAGGGDNDDDDDDVDGVSDYPDSASTVLTTRRKRYTEYQENALAICAGDCMYTRRMGYGDCYEMCNWNGRTPSPWKKFDKQYQEEQQTTRKNYASRVLTHRFGQRKESASSSPASIVKSQGRGKIKVKSSRPTGRPAWTDGGGSRKKLQNRKTGSRQTPGAKSTGSGQAANSSVGTCSR